MSMEAPSPVPVGNPLLPIAGGRCPCCGAVVHPVRGERRFTLMDAMFLVAASGVAFAIVRPLVSSSLRDQPIWATYLAAVMGGLVTWTPTVLFLRLRRPRPSWRRLSRQPGFAASLAATSILALGALAIALLALVRVARQGANARSGSPTRLPDPYWWLGVVFHFGAFVGPAVLGAWLLLAFNRRRRPSRGWIDPLGRAIGVVWIVLFVVHACFRLAYLRN